MNFKVTDFSICFQVRCVRFSPDGRMLVSCADDKTVKLHDVQTASTIHSFPELKGSSNHVAFHPSGTCIAVANTDNSVKVNFILHYFILYT